MDAKELEKLFKKTSQFDKTLEMDLKIIKAGEIEYSMTVSNCHLSSPTVSHGGAIAGMMDNVLGVTALSYAVTQNKLCSTVEFKINYLNPAKLGDKLTGTAQIDYIGKRLVVTSGFIKCGEKLIAKGMGTFNLYPMEKFKQFAADMQVDHDHEDI
ncbi:MAG: hypothetical protein Fur0010_22800 [Bdellovibrio sp.]